MVRERASNTPRRSVPRPGLKEMLAMRSSILSVVVTATTFASTAAAAPTERDAAAEPRAERPHAEDVDPAHAVVLAEAQAGLGTRSFDYVDRVTPGLRSYGVSAAPRVGIAGEVYPLAPFRSDLPSGLGLALGYSATPYLQSEGQDGAALETRWTSLDAALRMRVPLARGSMVTGTLGYGGVDFGFAADPTQLRERATGTGVLPEVRYRFVRAGADGRVAVWRLAVLAGLDYLFVTSTGAVEARFPRSSAGGIEARLGVAYPIVNHVELRTALRYQRFFHDLAPEPGDANVAGGALDELGYWQTSLALTF